MKETTTWFNILGNNSKCITKIGENIEFGLQGEDNCLRFNHDKENKLIIDNKCLTNELSMGKENCFKTNYMSEGVLKNENICFDNTTGKKTNCYLTPDYYLRLRFNSDYH